MHDKDILQQELLRLQEWSKKWLLEFNESKCSVMHLGRTNQKYDYSINNTVLTESKEEKDLGVFVTPDWKCSTHVSKIAAKANSAVGRIRDTFSYMDCDIFKAIYPGLIRSYMEYAVHTWSPLYVRDIDKLEKVQRRATTLVPTIKDKPYDERLKILREGKEET